MGQAVGICPVLLLDVPLDTAVTLLSMKKPEPSLAQLRRQYAQCRRQLAQIGYISQGSVQDRTERAGGGAGYQWTRKVAGKTVTVALTEQQFETLKEAVINRRRVSAVLSQMEKLSRQILFATHPHPDRRKHLGKKALGLI